LSENVVNQGSLAKGDVINPAQFGLLILDAQANASCPPDADVARPESRGRILVIATREDVTMLREVIQVLGRTG
jgi:hypothetical protein